MDPTNLDSMELSLMAQMGAYYELLEDVKNKLKTVRAQKEYIKIIESQKESKIEL